ncbi:MAG TPA: penicillin-binding protein 2 [Caulobacteraceae bacterium]|nr:penicillin-binding protein 2 [Caulobacteraceae bacterium]
MSLADLIPGRLPPGFRWVGEAMWSLEHAFERSKAADRPEDDTRIRIFFVLAIFTFAFGVLGIGAVRSAVFSDAARSGGWGGPVAGARADLVDRHGQLLALDLTHYGLYLDPAEVWDVPATRQALLRTLPELESRRLERALRANKRSYLIGALTPQERDRVHHLGLPGIYFEEEQRRVYPLGPLAAHLIGFTDSGGVGLAGVERALNEEIQNASVGHGQVPLSIDLRVQAALEEELQNAALAHNPKGAVGIVTNVHTGEILAMASYPDFDPNDAGQASNDARLNRAAAAVFEMGSTFKAFTVAIGLDAGVATPSSTFDATQPFQLGYRTIRDYHGTNRVLTLVDVFIHSSNIGTAKLADAIGAQRLEKYFTGLGLTRPAQVELQESARPLTPRVWDEDAVASTSFGHGMNVTPLALAAAYNTILNGGVNVPLTIRRQPAGYRPKGERVMSEETSLTMLQIMRANVERGTGGKADAEGLSVGGKTGTGEKYDPEIRGYSTTKQVSSFAAVFPTDGPIDAPRYFVLILLDEPKGNAETFGFSTGGWVAAPAAGKVIDRIAPFLDVHRREPAPLAVAQYVTGPEDGH